MPHEVIDGLQILPRAQIFLLNSLRAMCLSQSQKHLKNTASRYIPAFSNFSIGLLSVKDPKFRRAASSLPLHASHHFSAGLEQHSPYTPINTQFNNSPKFYFLYSHRKVSIKEKLLLPSFYHLSTTFNTKDLSSI